MMMLKIAHWRSVRPASRKLKICQDSPSRRFDAEILPIDPGKSGGQVGGVPLLAAFGPNLTSEAAVDVGQRFHFVRVVEDFAKQRDVSNRQAQSVDFRKPLFVGKRRYVNAEFLESCVDA
jgi:hypothetical protein